MKVPFADLIEAKQGRIDRDRADNRIVNLRDVTSTENTRNKVGKCR